VALVRCHFLFGTFAGCVQYHAARSSRMKAPMNLRRAASPEVRVRPRILRLMPQTAASWRRAMDRCELLASR